MKVADLEGAELDYWVARSIDLPLYECGTDSWPGNGKVWGESFERPVLTVGLQGRSAGVFIERDGKSEAWRPSKDWIFGGYIIERERIAIFSADDGKLWGAEIRQFGDHWIDTTVYDCDAHGPTPLIAAMRAYVASKFGDDVLDATDSLRATRNP